MGFGENRVKDIVSDSSGPKTAVLVPYPGTELPHLSVVPEKKHSYEEVAASIGFKPAELTRMQLLEFFEQNGMELYKYYEVIAWLTDKKKQVGEELWCWRPLREKDAIKGYRWGWNRERSNWNDGFYASNHWNCRPYERLVPKTVIEKVAAIEAKFGDDVKFFVSDFAKPGDPFIMVRPTKCDSGTSAEYHLVFDGWDEPGFGFKS